MIKTVVIKKGEWQTLEVFWNAKGDAFFRGPAGVIIKVRYGVGFLGFDSQKRTLDGKNYNKLSVGLGSIAYARMQVWSSNNINLTYETHPGGLAASLPEVNF